MNNVKNRLKQKMRRE